MHMYVHVFVFVCLLYVKALKPMPGTFNCFPPHFKTQSITIWIFPRILPMLSQGIQVHAFMPGFYLNVHNYTQVMLVQ